MSESRSKRLRKKLRVSEFQEVGFSISFTLSDHLSSEALNGFSDRFLAEAIENNGLLFGGGIGGNSAGFVTFGKRGSATEEHRALVRKWVAAHPFVADLQVGNLVDAWNFTEA
jgi:uncharacterized protein YggL (DUF469 family)